MASNNFLKFIAILQTIGIILVVFGHSFHEHPGGDMGFDMLIYRMFHSFRMPLFMFVSGFLMVFTTFKNDRKPLPSINKFFSNKAKRLLLPFIVISALVFIPRALLSDYADSEMDMSWKDLFDHLIFSGNAVIPYYWFLQASFILLICSYSFIWLGKRFNVPDYITFFSLFLVTLIIYFTHTPFDRYFSVSNVCDLGIFFTLGCMYCHLCETVDKFLPWDNLVFLLFCALVWGALFFLTEGSSWMFICSIMGILMCISLAKFLVKKQNTSFDHLFGTNYIIFLLSWFFNVATQQVLHHFIELPWFVYTIFSLVFGVYGPWLIFQIMRKHRSSRLMSRAAFLLGQKL